MNNLLSFSFATSLLLLVVLACSSSSSSRQGGPTNGINVSAGELIAAYEANEVAADQHYKNTAVAVTGVVDSIGKDIFDSPYVILKSSNKNEIWSCAVYVQRGWYSSSSVVEEG